MQKYVYEEDSSTAYRRYCGRLDADVYLCASEIFARTGRLDFTFSTVKEAHYLEQAADNLLMAAYYASKVGESQRTAHWLANASRVYCRLGKGNKARKLANIAERVINRAIDQRYSDQYKEAIMAEVYLSRGEKLLLIDDDPLRSLHFFGRAVQAASYLGFVRLLADSLYDVARAAEAIDEPVDLSIIKGAYGGRYRRSSSGLVQAVRSFLASLDAQKSWADIAIDFKKQAQNIWHQWAFISANDAKAVHPIEEAIEHYQHLQRVR